MAEQNRCYGDDLEQKAVKLCDNVEGMLCKIL